ncbi:MAG: RdgB/HAM1 family non-canonical purine NTP pyrophosphatase [Candidatus Krumholzibacteria bacterium]|nr:RdgB/HAM1 family non-canonical purine NTP pyrophosphatase [Candidatus Krumholzibacteria bacterium]
MSLRIVLATRNAGKIREIRSILADLDVELLDSSAFPPFPEPPEDGDTFYDNALLKAKAVHRATGLPALADDSGIEVDALGGAPGVRSARFGGAALTDAGRCAKLLEALRGVDAEKRGAHFHCVAVLFPAPGKRDGDVATEGFLYGRIAESPRGDNGFGYDPVFFVPERGRTVAEMDAAEKNSMSHRYRALVELKHLLDREYGIALRS